MSGGISRLSGAMLGALGASALGCSSTQTAPQGPEHAVVSEPRPAATPAPTTSAPAPNLVDRCASVGPMACPMAPSSHADLCAHAAACLRSFTKDGEYLDEYSLECDGDGKKDLARAYSKPVPAPAESGVQATSLVVFAAVRDGYSYVFESQYLVADFADGACLVDRVHDWDRPSLYADTTFDAEWTPRGQRVSVRSRQILHEALDQEELADDVSDVRSDYCQRITYDVIDGRFTRVAESSTEGSADDCEGPR